MRMLQVSMISVQVTIGNKEVMIGVYNYRTEEPNLRNSD